MPTECIPEQLVFEAFDRRCVTAAFDGGAISTDAGALLLRHVWTFPQRHVWTSPRRQGFFGLVPVAVMYTSFAGPWRFAACPGS